MGKIQYYGVVDLENPVDGCCWNKAESPETIYDVEGQYGKNIELLRFDWISAHSGNDEGKWGEYLTFFVDSLTKDIYGYCGGDKDDFLAALCMVCIIPNEAGADRREMIRRILIHKGIGQVRFVAKEIAAAMYARKVQGITKTTDIVFLLIDVGELRGTVSIIKVQNRKVSILDCVSCAECGARFFDRAFLGWLSQLFDAGFQKFKTNRTAFGKFLENWIDGRIHMEVNAPIKLSIGNLDIRNLRSPVLGETGEPIDILSNGYFNRLSLSADQIQLFGGEVFEKVWMLFEQGMARTVVYDPKPLVVMNGCYLVFPPLCDYLKDRGRAQIQGYLLQERMACIRGALALMQKTEDWLFTGILKRTWGIVITDENGKTCFETLLPGGEELPLGYEKRIFVTPRGESSKIEILFCSVPTGWCPEQDERLISMERCLQIISPNLRFPRRKIQVGIRVSDKLQLSVYDLTSGNRIVDEAEPVWEQEPDLII